MRHRETGVLVFIHEIWIPASSKKKLIKSSALLEGTKFIELKYMQNVEINFYHWYCNLNIRKETKENTRRRWLYQKYADVKAFNKNWPFGAKWKRETNLYLLYILYIVDHHAVPSSRCEKKNILNQLQTVRDTLCQAGVFNVLSRGDNLIIKELYLLKVNKSLEVSSSFTWLIVS